MASGALENFEMTPAHEPPVVLPTMFGSLVSTMALVDVEVPVRAGDRTGASLALHGGLAATLGGLLRQSAQISQVKVIAARPARK